MKKQNRKKRNSLRQAFCGNKKDKKTLKMQKRTIRDILYKTRTQQKKKTNHQNQENDKKKHLFAFWQTTPYFC